MPPKRSERPSRFRKYLAFFLAPCFFSGALWFLFLGSKRGYDCALVLTGVGDDQNFNRCLGDEAQTGLPSHRTNADPKSTDAPPSLAQIDDTPSSTAKVQQEPPLPAPSTATSPPVDKDGGGRRRGVVATPEPPRHELVKEAKKLAKENRGDSPPLHFWTFGSGRWKGAVLRLSSQAKATGLFKGVYPYTTVPDSILKEKRWEKVVGTYLKGRGYGYWFWKAAVTEELLNTKVDEGGWLVYADAGCSVGNKPSNHLAWKEFIKLMKDYDIIAFRIDHLEKKFTKGDIFGRFGMTWNSTGYGNAKQVCATAFMMANNQRTRKFVKMWTELVTVARLLTDMQSKEKNWKSFRENRHDQSLFSMMIKANCPQWPDSKAATDSIFYGKFDPGWAPQPLHKEFGIEGLRVLVLRDLTWPPKLDLQAISATRKASR